MLYTRSWMNVALLLSLLAGCRLPGREGPVPRSLADCRRFSQQGMAELDRGHQQQAEALLAKAVQICPVDAEARRRYAESLWRRGARPEAIAQMEEAGRLMAEDAALWARLAEMYLAAGQPERAWRTADLAMDLDPKLPSVWAIRGGVMQAAGQPREALNDYLRALSYVPNDREILMQVAETYRQLNQPERALQTLQTLAETYSSGEEPGRILYQMGLAYQALGRYDDAVESLSVALTREKPTPEMFFRLGEAQYLAGHTAGATASARAALALQPQHQPSRELLDRIELAQREQGTMRK
jgi:tetratricopeptide (TPR) repeat protein